MANKGSQIPGDSSSAPEVRPQPRKPTIGNPGILIVLLLSLFLATIVVPRECHGKSREARAIAQMKGIELALTKVLTDAGVPRLQDLFNDPEALDGNTDEETIERHTEVLYMLLRNGRNAQLDLRPEIRPRLANAYMDLGIDPWKKNRYAMYMPYGHGEEANALDRQFIETYMTFVELSEGGAVRPWRKDPQVYVVCRGKDGRLELFDKETPDESSGTNDDLSNLRDYHPASIETR